MADLQPVAWPSDGSDPTGFSAASAGGDQFVNDGNTLFVITNGGGAGITVTIQAARKSNHGVASNLVVTIAAGMTRRIGRFQPERFNDGGGRVSVGYSAVTSVTVKAARLGDLRGVTTAP